MTDTERDALFERVEADAVWLKGFVRDHTTMSGHDWSRRDRAEQHLRDLRALLDLARTAGVEGWKLVPREPFLAMLAATNPASTQDRLVALLNWRAMYDAAPSPTNTDADGSQPADANTPAGGSAASVAPAPVEAIRDPLTATGPETVTVGRFGPAVEVKLLQEALKRYGDRFRMATAPEHLQQAIDRAMASTNMSPAKKLEKEPSSAPCQFDPAKVEALVEACRPFARHYAHWGKVLKGKYPDNITMDADTEIFRALASALSAMGEGK